MLHITLTYLSLFVVLCGAKVVENPEIFVKQPVTVPPLFSNVSNSLPIDFIWGYASSAPQVEGAVDVDGKSPSQWDVFSNRKGAIIDGTTPNTTINEYQRWEETVELLKMSGANAYRFSIAWSRLIPEALQGSPINQKAVNHYNNLIDKLIKNGITPMITLFHYDAPQVLVDTYESVLNTDRFSEDFVYFADTSFRLFGDRVKHWATFNEPISSCILGYGNGMHAPGYGIMNFHLNFSWQLLRCGHTLLIAHAKAVQLYRSKYQLVQKGFITMVCNIQFGEPITLEPINVNAAQMYIDFSYGWFADSIHFGDYPESFKNHFKYFIPKFSSEEKELLKMSYDYVGVNQYTTTYIGHSRFKFPYKDPDMISANPLFPFVSLHFNLQGQFIGNGKAASTWLFSVPWGMTKSLEYIQKRYDDPDIYIMENGFSVPEENHLPMYEVVHDVQRIYFFQDYLNAIQVAMKQSGVKVKAYIAWTLTDNFEWNSGFTTPFGVTKMDLETGKRYVKDSAYYLKNYFRHAISEDPMEYLSKI